TAQAAPGHPPRSLLVARDQEIEGGFLSPGHAPTQHLIGWLHSPSLLSLLLILDIPLELPPILAPIAPVAPQVLAVGPEVLPRVLDLVLVAALDRVLQLLAIFANVAPVVPDLPAILPQLLHVLPNFLGARGRRKRDHHCPTQQCRRPRLHAVSSVAGRGSDGRTRSEEHTSELQSRGHLVC